MRERLGRSEFEWQVSYLLIFCLGELVFECGQELRVDLHNESFDVFHDRLQVLVRVLCRAHHFFVPNVDLLDAFSGED